MKRVRFIPVQVKTEPDDRPQDCPHCGYFELVKRRTRRQARHRPLRGCGQSPQLPLQSPQTNLQALPEGSRREKADATDARMDRPHAGARHVAALRQLHARRLRSLPLAHERLARRPGSGAKVTVPYTVGKIGADFGRRNAPRGRRGSTPRPAPTTPSRPGRSMPTASAQTRSAIPLSSCTP